MAGSRTASATLSRNAPYLAVLNKESIQVPYHSIIGNRGKPGPLAESTDGVVPYWSSHLDGAKSELLFPARTGHVNCRKRLPSLTGFCVYT